MNDFADQSGRRTQKTIGKKPGTRASGFSSSLTARRNRLALAIGMALMSPVAFQSAYAGVGTVCSDGSTPTSFNPAARACAPGTATAPVTAIGTYYANSPQLRKFVDTLPGLTPGNANTFGTAGTTGEYIPIAVADTTTYPGSEYFIIGVVEHQQRMHSDLQKATTLRSYVQLYPRLGTGFGQWPDDGTGKPVKATDGLTQQVLPAPVALKNIDGSPIFWPGTTEQVYGFDKPHYLGPIILTFTGTPVRTQMVNLLPTGRATPDGAGSVTARNGDIFLPVDESLGGAGVSPTGDKYPQNRAAFHLHGGDSPWISDGTPHQWIAPAADPSLYKAGNRLMNVPDMPFPGAGSQTIFWPNDQSSRLMWYHDHTFGLTRQNAYSGEAAGYVIIDGAELALQGGLAGTTPSTSVNGTTISKVLPNGLLDQIVLIVQDKTFVPDDVAKQDSKWDTKAWGQPGDLWYPHVYEPVQLWGNKPDDTLDSQTITRNPAGRWDYAVNDGTLMYLPPTVPLRTDPEYGDVAFPDGSYADGTPGKGPSATPESYMDTAMVNGVAYPTKSVEPKAYRVRFLNGANDRYWNLSLWVADTTAPTTDTTGKKTAANTEIKMVPEVLPSAITMVTNGTGYIKPQVSIVDKITLTGGKVIDGTGIGATATATVDAASGAITAITLVNPGSGYVNPQVVITEAGRVAGPNDATVTLTTVAGRPEGVPDPANMGPSIVQFANEAGFLPVPVVHKPAPMQLNAFGEEIAGDFYLGGAERADTVIDFSQYAGKTLIMYNDSTAPVPGGDTRYDYYTGNPDQTTTGGAPSTAPGYGPNTRTVMQFVVGDAVTSGIDYPYVPGAISGTKAYNNAALISELSVAYTAVADTHVVGAAAGAPDANLGALPFSIDTTASTLTLVEGAIPVPMQIKTIHGFTDPNIGRLIAQLGTELPGAIGSPTPLGYIDSATDIIQAGDTQYWWIKNYDVDNHPMHFHLFNVQVLAHRVIGTGLLRPPEPDEMGWKETVKNWPGEDVIVALRPKTPQLPFGLPKSVRTMDPTLNAGADVNDVLYGAKKKGDVTNDYAGVSGTYKGSAGNVITTVPFAFSQIDLNPFKRDANGNFRFDGNGRLISNSAYGNLLPANPDGTAAVNNATQDFGWEYVWHCHILGHEENDLMRPMVFIPEVTKSATGPNAVAVSATGNVTWTDPTPAYVDPTALTLVPDPATKGNTDNEIGFRVERLALNNNPLATSVGFAALTAASPVVDARVNTLANATSFKDTTVLPYTDYQYRVVAVNEAGDVPSSSFATLTQPAAAPSALAVATVPATTARALTLNWVDNATNEDSFSVEASTNGGATYAILGTTVANAASFAATVLPATTYTFRVGATKTNLATTYSSTVSATTPIELLAPVVTAASSLDGSGLPQVVVSWTDTSSGETGYTVERCAGTAASCALATANWVMLTGTALAANSTSYIDSTVAAATNYVYRVKAVAGATAGALASSAQVTTAIAITAPSGLAAASPTGVGVTLTWTDTSINETSFQVERMDPTTTTGFAVIGTVTRSAALKLATGGVVSYADASPSLVAGVNYSYQVRAVNLTGTTTSLSAASNTATIMLGLTTPTGLTATQAGANITLKWVDTSATETAFDVLRTDNNGVTIIPMAVRTAAQTTAVNGAVTYTDTTAVTGTTYSYAVRAVNAPLAGAVTYSANSASVSATVVLPAPTLLTTALPATGTGVVLNWVDNATFETGYQVVRTTLDGNSVLVPGSAVTLQTIARTGTATTGTGAVSYTDTTPIPAGQAFSYVVYAMNGTALSAASNAATTTAAAAVTGAPSALTAVTTSGTSVVLSWIDNSTTETSFLVSRTDGVNVTTFSVARTPAQGKAVGAKVSYTDSTALVGGAVVGTSYTYTVAAVTPGLLTSAPVTAGLSLSAPVLPTATQTATGITIGWTDASNNETGFEIVRDGVDAKGGAIPRLVIPVASNAAQTKATAAARTYIDANINLIPGVTYTYTVAAKVVAPSGTVLSAAIPTNPTTITDLIAAPGIPTAVITNATKITLGWLDLSTNETGFVVERAITPAGSTTQSAWTTLTPPPPARTAAQGTSTKGAVSYVDILVAPVVQGSYQYRVTAVNLTNGVTTSSTSSLSLPLDFTAPVAPTGLTATPGATGVVNLSWVDNASTETGFTVQRATDALFTKGLVTTVVPGASAGTGATVNYALSGLTKGTPLFFKVAATNAVGASTFVATTAAVLVP
jgi:FtsP/CotA-like multicopper oxidase with cupredoxin domain